MADPLQELAAPARRALASIGVTRLDDLVGHTEDEVSALHGMGRKAMNQLRDALEERGLSFRGEDV